MSPTPTSEPVQEFFSIGEVCDLTGLKPHVLRYWESQFRFLSPAKNRSGNRVYQRREVELIMLVKHLLYDEKYTIEGARQKVDEHRKGGDRLGEARGIAAISRDQTADEPGAPHDVRVLRAAVEHFLGGAGCSAMHGGPRGGPQDEQVVGAQSESHICIFAPIWCDICHCRTVNLH